MLFQVSGSLLDQLWSEHHYVYAVEVVEVPSPAWAIGVCTLPTGREEISALQRPAGIEARRLGSPGTAQWVRRQNP